MKGEFLVGRLLYSSQKPLQFKEFRVLEYDGSREDEEYKVGVLDDNGNIELKALFDKDFVEACSISLPSEMTVEELISILSKYNQNDKVRLSISCSEYGECNLEIKDDGLMFNEVG